MCGRKKLQEKRELNIARKKIPCTLKNKQQNSTTEESTGNSFQTRMAPSTAIDDIFSKIRNSCFANSLKEKEETSALVQS